MTEANKYTVRLRITIQSILMSMLLLRGIPCPAQEMPIPAEVQYALITKILAFDKHLNEAGKRELVIGILFQNGFRMSKTTRDELIAAMEQSPATNVCGMSVRFTSIDIDNGLRVSDMISPGRVDALYITPLRAIDIETIVALSRSRKIITLTGVPEYAEEGVAVSIGIRDERPLIIVNLPAAKAEGADLSSQLLKVSKVIQ